MKTIPIILFASLALATQELFSRSGSPPGSPTRSRPRSHERSPSGSREQSRASSPSTISLKSTSSQSQTAGGLLRHTNVLRGYNTQHKPDPRYASASSPARVQVKLAGPGSIYTESGRHPSSDTQYDKKDMFSWSGTHSKDLTFTHPEKLRVSVASARDGSSLSANGLRASSYMQAEGVNGLGSVHAFSNKNGPTTNVLWSGLYKPNPREEFARAHSNDGATAHAMSFGDDTAISASASNSPAGSPSALSKSRTPLWPSVTSSQISDKQ